MTRFVAGQPGLCSVCSHPRAAEIDDALLNGSQRGAAARFGLNPSSVHRHFAGHLKPRMRAAAIANRKAGESDGRERLHQLAEKTDQILASVLRARKFDTALRAVREARENVLAMARLTGELRDPVTGGNTYVMVFEGGVPKVIEEAAAAIETSSKPALPAPGDGGDDGE